MLTLNWPDHLYYYYYYYDMRGNKRVETKIGTSKTISDIVAFFCTKVIEPKVIELACIEACNGRCRYCYHWKLGSHHVELKYIIKLLQELQQWLHKDLRVDICGGEPTLRSDLPDIIRACLDFGFTPTLVTNGYRLADSQYAKSIASTGINSVIVSVDGFEDTNDYQRGPGSFKKAIKAMENLATMGIEANSLSVITRKNIAELDDFLSWLEGKKYGKMYSLQALGNYFGRFRKGGEWHKDNELWPRDENLIDDSLNKLISRNAYTNLTATNPPEQLIFWKQYFKNPLTLKTKRRFRCTIGDKYFHFGHTGKIHLCHVLNAIGSIQDNDIRSILLSNVAKDRRKEVRNCRKVCNYIINCQYQELMQSPGACI